MRGTIIVAALVLSACGANERRSEGAATQADIENSAATPLPAPIAPRAPSPTPTPPPSATATATATPAAEATRYLGRWIGVEGMYLNVTQAATPGAVKLEMQYDLDNKGQYTGTVTPEGIRFKRGADTLLLRPSDGDATGLKWLAGKKDCLTVATGEGYCRD